MSYIFSVNTRSALHIEHIRQQAGLEDLEFVNESTDSNAGYWPEKVSHVHRHGVSVRAVEVEHAGDTITLRISAASSPDDYDLALRLVAAIAKSQNATISTEDNQAMTLDQFYASHDKSWAVTHGRNSLSAVLGEAQSSHDAVTEITGVHAVMRLGKRVLNQLIVENSKIDSAFYHRLRTLNYLDSKDIYQASVAVLANRDGSRNVRMSTYAENVATLITDKNTLVSLVSREDLEKPPLERRVLRVPTSELQRLIGEEAIWLSEDMLLAPKLKGHAWRNMVARAADHHVEDLFEYSYDPENDPYASVSTGTRVEMTQDDLNELAYAPVAVFCFVAAADGKIDKKEINAFKQEVVTRMSSDHKVVRTILLSTVSAGDSLFDKFINKEVDVLQKIRNAATIIDRKLSRQEAMHVKKALLDTGLSVAEASGGLLGRFGSKVCKEEKQALALMASIFGLR